LRQWLFDAALLLTTGPFSHRIAWLIVPEFTVNNPYAGVV